ncbi:MAG: Uma2 family endonuclease [Acidobacteriota bacterium]
MSQRLVTYITPQEYVKLEREAEYKSEYLNGEIFAMIGASRAHNLITTNISGEFRRQLKGRPCETYAGDMRVNVTSIGFYTYPDVVVVCGAPQFEDSEFDTLLNPTVLVEILSKSTERYDRMAKTFYYRTVESLAEHVLVAQHTVHVEQYVKQPNGDWLLIEFTSPEQVVQLGSIDCSLQLTEVYDRVTFDPNYRVTR